MSDLNLYLLAKNYKSGHTVDLPVFHMFISCKFHSHAIFISLKKIPLLVSFCCPSVSAAPLATVFPVSVDFYPDISRMESEHAILYAGFLHLV